ncbi:MAG: right-handed parallel beta-helix repeat-containing protein, partial [Caldilineaceae bacterium]|nr:right-handed parallel beta-helix repeat-containing protein [Caldilineaceae bacterium]
YVDESDVTIRNSNIMSGTGPGLNVYQGAAVVEGSTISGMGSGQYNPTTTSTVNYRGYGVYGSNHTALDLRNNLISYNDERGVFLIGTNRIMLAGNNFVSNLDAVYLHGIQLLPGSGENQASGNRVNAIRIHDHIHVDEAIVYSNLPYVIDYLRVEAGRTLTIPAGQIFKPFNGNLTGLPRINILGTLVVQGTADEPVIFTSVYDDSIGGETYRTPTLPSPGDWTGFYFAPTSSGNALEHVEIRYAGAVYDLPHPDPAITTLANFPFTLSSVYVDESDVTIRNSNIMSGTGPGLNVYQGAAVIEGSTIADMNAGQHQPTTTSTFRYYGHGIYGSNFTALDLRNNFISHNNDRGVFLFGTKDIMLADNNFVSNFDAVRMQGVQLLPGSGNNQASGNRFNAILLYDHVHTNKTLVYSNLPYVVEYLRVEAGQTLTIPAGQVFKPASGNLTNLPRINILGAIAVQGTAEQPVVFTSIHDDTAGGNTYGPATQPAPGDWTGIYFAPTSSGSILEHMEVRYAGAKYDLPHNDPAVTNGSTTQFTASSIYVDESDITVHHNVISAGAGSGINVYGGRADVVGSIISSMQTAAITIAPSTYNYTGFGIFSVNANINLVGNEITKNVFGIYVRTPTTTYIRSNSIIGNSNYGLAANASQPIDARENWWGSDSGPRPHGTGDRVNNVAGCFADCNIRVYNWLGQDTFVRQSLGDSGPAVVYQAKAGDPVNTANGNYYYSYTDLLIQTRSFPLGFARTYNSLLPQEGPLGWGWTHSWHSYLTENLDSSVMVVFGDGHGEKWFSDGAAFVGAPGVYGQLVKNGDGSYDLTQKNQTRYHFDNNLRLAYVEDKNNNRTTLAYDPQGRLTNVTEPAGRALTLSYASPISPTLISQVADHSGRAVSFTYDSAANLVKVTDVIGQELTITYDANHRLLTQTDANNHTFNTNVYDERGRVVEQFDADGNRWTFNYDVINNITVVTDPLGRSTTYDYDNELRLTAEIDALNKKMRYTYDANGNRIEVVDKRGYASSMSYDLRGNMLVMTDTLGYVSTHSYD